MTTPSERNKRVARVLLEVNGGCVGPGINHDYSCTDQNSGQSFCCECGGLKPFTRADLYGATQQRK